MGTRSITVVKDGSGNKIVEIYKQYDGYPESLGEDLKVFVSSGKLVNGLVAGRNWVFNGVECFAAQLVGHLKHGEAGNVYLLAPTEDFEDKREYSKLYDAEYYYEISANLELRCWDCWDNKEIFLNKKDEK